MFPKQSKVAAIVITFNPDETFVGNITAIASQFVEVIVVDNFSSNIGFIRVCLHHLQNVSLIELGENTGIAHASNIGIVNSSYSMSWLAFFDQDTHISKNYLSEIIDQSRNFLSSNVAIIAPYFSGEHESQAYFKAIPLEVEEVIASGSIMSREWLNRIGLFESAMFIDYVDTEICLRISTAKGKILMLPGVSITHKLGDVGVKKLFGKKFLFNNHSNIRKYYITRNRIYVYRHYYSKKMLWCVRDSKKILVEAATIVLWEKNKLQKILDMLKGARDGFSNKMGKYAQS